MWSADSTRMNKICSSLILQRYCNWLRETSKNMWMLKGPLLHYKSNYFLRHWVTWVTFCRHILGNWLEISCALYACRNEMNACCVHYKWNLIWLSMPIYVVSAQYKVKYLKHYCHQMIGFIVHFISTCINKIVLLQAKHRISNKKNGS